ncbi:MAG TPA: serine/threonine-protein kinase, partial [Thermoanaerobaculia bacterium]
MSEDLPASTASGPFPLSAATIALLAPGTSVGGRYRVDEVIGTGGYAVVYLAFDRELNRNVALKVLRPERASPEGLARFRREVAVARDISSPRLVRVFDIGSSENAVYLTMEHVEGESLKERLRRGPRSIEEAIAMSVSILEGLEALHRASVIHRDVKPGNVLLGRDGEVKLGDFGLARSGIDDASLTHSGALLGTSEYVAPEQALGHEPRSDLYSTGIVMYEMLTGQPPFSAESPLGVLLARLKASAPDPRKVRREIPSWLARIVLRLLERKPGARYPNAAAVLRDLGRRRARYRLRRPIAVSGVALVLLLVLGGVAANLGRDAQQFSPLLVRPEGGVTAVARDGRPLWSLPNPQPPGMFALTNDPPVCDLQA